MNVLIDALLKSVFSKPNRNVTKNRTGLPPGKMFGVCYNYYLNGNYKNDPEIHDFLRKKVAKDISFSEVHKFSDTLEDEVIPKIVVSKVFSWRDERSLYEVVKKEEVKFIEKEFLRLKDEFKKDKCYFFPLHRVYGNEFTGRNFSIISTESLNESLQQPLHRIPYHAEIERWLRVSARSTERACERMEAICGGFALTIKDPQRYHFTMAHAASGHVDEKGAIHSLPPRIMPSLSTDIEVDELDIKWLNEIDKNISNERVKSKELQALRFMFFSWFAVSQERFALNCMALDALIPRKIDRMKAKCEWIKKTASVELDLYSIELLFKKIRSSIIHGSSASLPLCLDYPTFISLYRVEALSALDALTADVLKTHIFSSLLVSHVSPRDKDPEIRAMAEKIFGAENLAQIDLLSQPLKSLSKGYLSTWEKGNQHENIFKKLIRRLKFKAG